MFHHWLTSTKSGEKYKVSTVISECNDIKIVREPGVEARPSTAPGLGVCEWSPEGLHDKSVSLIPNTDKIIKFVKKK